tara:strand:- start:202 stop:984 length:783 start_codon:yes stop_codon:yes gene_type:complete
MEQAEIDQAVASLLGDFESWREYSLMQEPFAPGTEDEAYAIQAGFMGARAAGGRFAGYKIAWTTPVMQERAGASEPVYGRLLESQVLTSPATVSMSQYLAFGVECEVAVRLGRDLAGEDLGESEVMDAVAEVMLAFELIDSRGWAGPRSPVQSISMNISGAGAVLGAPVRDWQTLDLAAAECRLSFDNAWAASGWGSDLGGHPVLPVGWLAGRLARQGRGLKAGDVVITGSMIPPQFPQPGVTAELEMAGLGAVSLDITG